MMNKPHAIGWKAKDFALQGTDGKTYSLTEIRGPKGTLVVFICNHCPYVKASINRIVAEATRYARSELGQSPSCQTIQRPIPRTPSTT
jgi:peroxiredoxin